MRPNLLHPVPVYIRKIDHRFTAVYDHDLHEPVGQVRREQKPVMVPAQIQMSEVNSPQPSNAGIIESSSGYVLFRVVDLEQAGIEIERGDRIVQIGEDSGKLEVDYYITKLVPMGHYGRAGGYTLLRAYFEDRQPSRVRE